MQPNSSSQESQHLSTYAISERTTIKCCLITSFLALLIVATANIVALKSPQIYQKDLESLSMNTTAQAQIYKGRVHKKQNYKKGVQMNIQGEQQIQKQQRDDANQTNQNSENYLLSLLERGNPPELYDQISVVSSQYGQLDELSLCILIDASTPNLKQEIIRSIKSQQFKNYHLVILSDYSHFKISQPNSYHTLSSILQQSACGISDVIIPIQQPLKFGALNQINDDFQQFHTYLLSAHQDGKVQIIAFYRRIFQLLRINNFDKTNSEYLEDEDYGIIAMGLIELSLHNHISTVETKSLFENKESQLCSLINLNFSTAESYNRTRYQKLWYLAQSYQIDEKKNQQNWKMFLQNKAPRHVASKSFTTPQQLRQAMEYRQLLYLPSKHALAKRQAILFNKKYQIDRYNNELPMCIVVPSYNNVQNNRYQRVILSLIQQNYTNYHIVFIDDFSDDSTLSLTSKLLKKLKFDESRVTLVQNLQKNWGVYNIMNGVYNYCGKNDHILWVDGDDEMIGKQTLRLINSLYQKNPNLWIIYSTFYSSKFGYGTSKQMKYNSNIIKNGKRIVGHKIGHLSTFKAALYKHIKMEDLKKKNGEWLDVMTDDTIQYPMTEMAKAPRILFVHEILYFYNRQYGNNVDATFEKKKYRRQIHLKDIALRQPYKTLKRLDDGFVNEEILQVLEEDNGKKYRKISQSSTIQP